jgi:hypothetical protein
MSELESSEFIEPQKMQVPKFWEKLAAFSPRNKAVNEFELGILVQKMVRTGNESSLLYDDQGERLSRQDSERVNVSSSIKTGGLAGFFSGLPFALIHTHPAVLNENETSLINIVDLPSPPDLADVDIHKMIIWGTEGIGFYATVIERPETEEDIKLYRLAVERYTKAVEENNYTEIQRILIEELHGKFYRLVEIDSSAYGDVLPTKKSGMTKEEEQYSSGLELSSTKSIYDQNGFKDRRYTLHFMTADEEKQVATRFYSDLNLHRQAEQHRDERRRKFIFDKYQNKPRAELLAQLDSSQKFIEDCNEQLAKITDSNERINLEYKMRHERIAIFAIESILNSEENKGAR